MPDQPLTESLLTRYNKMQEHGVMTYFTVNGEVWEPSKAAPVTSPAIAMALERFEDKSVIYGEHNGRSFNGINEYFKDNTPVEMVYTNEEGKIDPAMTARLQNAIKGQDIDSPMLMERIRKARQLMPSW